MTMAGPVDSAPTLLFPICKKNSCITMDWLCFLVQQNRVGHKNMPGRLWDGALSAVSTVTTITELSLGSRC